MQESSISEKIKELRTDLKMNQKNFSAAIGMTSIDFDQL